MQSRSNWPTTTSSDHLRVLVVAAHPDDEVLGCGGTIARLTREGVEVHIAILGEGLTSRDEQGDSTPASARAQMKDDAWRAAKLVGVSDVRFFDLPDNRFDTVSLLDIVKLIDGVIKEFQPASIFTQHGGDLNIDHAVTFRGTLTATRPMAGSPVRAVYAYEVPSSSEWSFQQFSPVFQPHLFVDIAATLERKIEAVRAYGSEVRAFPHPRSPEAIRATATRWGSVIGVVAAEAFQCVWELR